MVRKGPAPFTVAKKTIITRCGLSPKVYYEARQKLIERGFLTLDEEKNILTDAAKIFVIKGEKVALVQGETYNMKITYPYDLRVAKSLLEDESDD